MMGPISLASDGGGLRFRVGRSWTGLRLALGLALGMALVGAFPQSAVAQAKGPAPKKFAFLVGIDKYDKRGFATLKYAERDVNVLASELKKHGFILQMLTGSEQGELRATRENITTQLRKFLKGVTQNDVVMIVLSGHGLQFPVKQADGSQKDEAFYCPVDAIENQPDSLFSISFLIDDVLAVEGGRNLVLIDACRENPALARGKGAKGIEGQNIALPENTAVLFSCKARQRSFENELAQHGLFTYCVLEGLRGRATSANGEITWTGLAKYVEDRMATDTIKALIPEGGNQVPLHTGNVERTVLAVIPTAGATANAEPPTPTTPGNASTPTPSPNPVPAPGPKSTEVVANTTPASTGPPRITPPTATVPTTPGPTPPMPNPPGVPEEVFPPLKPGPGGRPRNTPSREVARATVPPPLPPDPEAGKKAGESRQFTDLRTEMIWCPPGSFFQGAPDWDRDASERERPGTVVRLTQGFWLGRCEVTQQDWERLMRTRPWAKNAFTRTGPNYPATDVSWDDALNFCRTLNQIEQQANRLNGWVYTLPTESQWEYACRAGTTTAYCYGENAAEHLDQYAWFKGNVLKGAAQLVGQKKPNRWGFCDMQGNVFEWCADWYADYPDKRPRTDPYGPNDGVERVIRGGNWQAPAEYCRSSFRFKVNPETRTADLGFRLARVPLPADIPSPKTGDAPPAGPTPPGATPTGPTRTGAASPAGDRFEFPSVRAGNKPAPTNTAAPLPPPPPK